MELNINTEDFGTLCICAIRYCQGRETYMPDLVRGIIKPYLSLIDDKDLTVMINDCDFQKKFNLYGNERIDKPGWIEWNNILLDEKDRRIAEANKRLKKFDPVKYEYGDWVKFKVKMSEDTEATEHIGQIAVIDKFGTFEQNEEPSYDIYVPEMNCLFKHFRQSIVEFDHKGDGTCSLFDVVEGQETE